MIAFFRKLRQRLLVENQFGRYLLYALGEVLLVMVGILLALQVDNWNEQRKEREIETGILQDLQTEFGENLSDANRVFEGNLGMYQAISTLQQEIANKSYDPTRTDSLMYFVFDWYDYTPKPGASNNLINAGNLNLITNKRLRELLTLWPGVVDELDDDEQLAIRYSQQIIVPFLSENYPMANLEKADAGITLYLPKEGSDSPDLSISEPKPYQVEKLLENPVFQNHLSAKKMYARHNLMECRKLVETASEILALIEKELNLRAAKIAP
jgi:hypothetical protein